MPAASRYAFYPRDAMPALALAMALCRCLSVSVCLSVCHKSVFCRNGWTDRADFWRVGFFGSILQCVLRKFKHESLWNFAPNSGLRKFRHSILIVEARYQLSSRKVDGQSVINWAIVGKLIIPPSSDARPLSFIAQIVKLCLQHDFVARVN